MLGQCVAGPRLHACRTHDARHTLLVVPLNQGGWPRFGQMAYILERIAEGFSIGRTIIAWKHERGWSEVAAWAPDRVQREELLRRAVLGGDELAWRTWYDETFDDLYCYVRWRCGGRRDWADEIVQETWLTAVRRIRRFDPRQGCFLVWLRGIAANVLRNDLRQRRRWPKLRLACDGQASENGRAGSNGEERQREERVAAALDALPEREEAVLRAKYLEGFRWRRLPPPRRDAQAIESLLSRARQAFREFIVARETNMQKRNDSLNDPVDAVLGPTAGNRLRPTTCAGLCLDRPLV